MLLKEAVNKKIEFKAQILGLLVSSVLCLVSCVFVGCATIAPPRVAELPIQKFYINNIPYYSLTEICRHFKIDWDYDSFARQISMKKADSEVKLLMDSSVALVNGSPLDIQQPLRMHNGLTVVPAKFRELVIDRFYSRIIPQASGESALGYAIRKVIVDAGHGGHDPGAIGRTGLREKDVNLDIARRLAHLLEAKGIDASMTRSVDKFISLEERAEIANRSKADFFISIHSNSARSARLNGFEVYYITDKINDYSRALTTAQNADLHIEPASFYNTSLNLKATLWDIIYTQSRLRSIIIAQSICQAASRNMGLRILGVKGAPFYVLKGTRIPAVLVEVGFVSHPSEERYLRSGFYRQQLAEAIAEGILNVKGNRSF